ncbi:MAG: hypothetical protein AVDCRST_MAG18-3892 [uncultured Thermomicrobiales bacterium]|uniref:Uncharacterized protein n=1 Tax=uncultured Thermomicrobiales bacterium TaxID=1645740 RepID=A0A6J4VQL0_9BACT|nr:MAG: hypothetical protein AVDCRST_MAG18-3892 [uncultured Thermomicrobiales bacterium]
MAGLPVPVASVAGACDDCRRHKALARRQEAGAMAGRRFARRGPLPP